MAYLILPSRWTRQPQYPVEIDWGNSLARGVQLCTMPQSGGVYVRSIWPRGLTPTIGDPAALSLSAYQDRFGGANALTTNTDLGATAWQYTSSSLAAFASSSTYTLLFVGAHPTSSGTRLHGFMLGDESGGGFTQGVLALNADQNAGGSAGKLAFWEYNGGFNVQAESNTSQVDGNIHVYAGRRNGSAATVWRDGVNVTSTSGGGGGTVSSWPSAWGFGGANGRLAKRSALGVAWNRALTDAELIELGRNPWQLFIPIHRRIYIDAPSTGATINPSVGSLVLTGQAPTATVPATTTQPALGELVIAGLAPTFTLQTTLNAGLGELVINGQAPSITVPATSVSPGVGALVFNGLAPTISLGALTVTPDVGLLTFSGLAPAITVPATTVSSNVGSLVFNGLIPSITVSQAGTVQPALGELVISGLAPTITVPATNVSTGLGALVLDGKAPTVSVVSDVIVNPLTGALIFAGHEPDICVNLQVLLPNADVAAGTWLASTGSDLYAMIDEATPSDADYIYTNTAGSVAEVHLQDVADPGDDDCHFVNFRVKGNGSAGIVVRLMQGATTIATFTVAAVPATETAYRYAVTPAQAAAITNYNDLRFQFEAS